MSTTHCQSLVEAGIRQRNFRVLFELLAPLKVFTLNPSVLMFPTVDSFPLLFDPEFRGEILEMAEESTGMAGLLDEKGMTPILSVVHTLTSHHQTILGELEQAVEMADSLSKGTLEKEELIRLVPLATQIPRTHLSSKVK